MNVPTILTVFGATGDLTSLKIVPALFHLWSQKKLPDMFALVGFSRQELSHADFRARVITSITNNVKGTDPALAAQFAEQAFYSPGQFDDMAGYTKLAGALKDIDDKWGVCSNKLFYLATPPSFYETIARKLSDSGLTIPCGGDQGWTRLIVEKPFGSDLKTAEALDELLGQLFKETQIYRIDHYLAKEMLQNIMAFRFSNNLFEKSWNNETVESIEIDFLEKLGAEDRGAFYDSVGALRDVGQNHLIQMLALVTMEHPQSYDADAIRMARSSVMRTLAVPTAHDVTTGTYRAQYEGYRSIKGVNPDSTTETYFKVRGFLNHPRWRGVPIIFQGGKRVAAADKKVTVTFKHPSPCLCGPDQKEHFKNRVIFSLEPKESITVQFWSKKPGLTMETEERDLQFDYGMAAKEDGGRSTDAYEKLLLDCICGDQTLFVSTDEIRAMWRFIDPIIDAWKENAAPLHTYKPDSKEVITTSDLLKALPVQGEERSIAMIGLGKMGAGLALHLNEQGWRVVGFDQGEEARARLAKEGIVPAVSLKEAVEKLSPRRIVWLMVPAGKPVDDTLSELLPLLSKEDIVIDGGNSLYKDTIRRAEKCKEYGVRFMDVGTSGGPSGARNGACLMIGGEEKLFEQLHPLFEALARPEGYGYMGKSGAGHFVKMVHNGIEYGMMQAIAEGFAVMKKSDLQLALTEITRLYNVGSVVESRLVGWLKSAYEQYGEDLDSITSTVAHSGEGLWTVDAAKELGIPVPIIEESLQFRVQSKENPSYTGKVLSALRNQFGGHKA